MEAGEAVGVRACGSSRSARRSSSNPGPRVYAGMIVGENSREQRHDGERLQDEAPDEHARLRLGRSDPPRAAAAADARAGDRMDRGRRIRRIPRRSSIRLRKRYLDHNLSGTGCRRRRWSTLRGFDRCEREVPIAEEPGQMCCRVLLFFSRCFMRDGETCARTRGITR
ncbi:MAG: hypothetical protein MZV64_35475 [Ignavibacteriales bacterium]|nr:hypothetical protein [Ignavibacteriales bacterium]